MKGFIKNLFGDKHAKDIKKVQPRVANINRIFESLSSLSNDELRGKTAEFQQKVHASTQEINEKMDALKHRAEHEEGIALYEKDEIYNEIDSLSEQRDEVIEQTLDAILEEAFAVVKETARRFKEEHKIYVRATELDKQLATTKDHIELEGDSAVYHTSWNAAGNLIEWDMLHYDVQLVGGMVLHSGKIAEMATGEGKTLVATLPAYLNGLVGYGVHIVTVNNYLAKRDAEWMGPIMEFLGLTVDCLDNYDPNTDERRAAYKANITYGTNNEFGFDYLRDNMVRNASEQVQQKL